MNVRTRTAAAAATLLTVMIAGTACSVSLPQSAPNAFAAATTTATDAAAPVPAQPTTVSFGFTGATETVTVPQGTASARITLRGADGGNSDPNYDDGGEGHQLTLEAPVNPDDVLTVAVGGHGWNIYGDDYYDGDGTGWSMGGHYGWTSVGGGVGARGPDGDVFAGAGGGGASLVYVNSTPLAVAAGGGGASREILLSAADAKGQYVGGDGGLREGGRGGPNNTGGYGGSAERPNLGRHGVKPGTFSYPAGGGGGGGYYGGEAGHQLFGGGGGASYLADNAYLIAEQVVAGTAGVSITFLPPPSLGPTGTVWAIAKAGTTKVLEVSGDAPHDGGTVDLWEQWFTSTGRTYANELWTFRPDGDSGYGWLVNNSTGKCLEVNHHTGAVDQWECLPGADNELWRAVLNTTGTTALQVKSSGAYLGVRMDGTASADGSESVTTPFLHDFPDGTPVEMTTTRSQATGWTLTVHS